MSAERAGKLLALLLPSKGRFLDLILTLWLTSLKVPRGYRVRFVVCANYSTAQLAILRILFSRRATIIDERNLEWRGMIGAYNYALDAAGKMGAHWVALWADDLLPAKDSWLDELFGIISGADLQFGIFSSDEGNHQGRFGWNVFAGYPCAHFFVARLDALPGHLLNPALSAYVGDNEIVISRTKKGVPIDLLPIKVVHQPTANRTRQTNASAYKADLDRFYQIHPELQGKLDAIVLRGDVANQECSFIVDEGKTIRFCDSTRRLGTAEFSMVAPITIHRARIRFVGIVRKLWNEVVMSPRSALRSGLGRIAKVCRMTT